MPTKTDKPTHTPGPHTIQEYECGCRVEREGRDWGTVHIRRCSVHAAAPDLLAAAEDAERDLTEFCDMNDSHGYAIAADSVYRARLAALRSAIVKARGGEGR